MNRFPRRPEPAFWGEYERRWLRGAGPKVDPLHDWVRLGRTLARWFHDEVRPEREPHNCAYCDGPLGVESPATIDHFIPKSRCRELSLCWENLYPACALCNTQAKRTSGSCFLLRPDVDPVEAWVDFNPRTGRLEPSAELQDRLARARVSRTLHVLHLNGSYELIRLGKNREEGEVYQAIVPAGAWFASETIGEYSFVGCTVAPGFDFADFELAIATKLKREYPESATLIERLCRQ